VRSVELDEAAVARSHQELRIDETRQQLYAQLAVQTPQTAGLRLRETEARHFEELSLDSPEQFF
jgi:hypothetical protein